MGLISESSYCVFAKATGLVFEARASLFQKSKVSQTQASENKGMPRFLHDFDWKQYGGY